MFTSKKQIYRESFSALSSCEYNLSVNMTFPLMQRFIMPKKHAMWIREDKGAPVIRKGPKPSYVFLSKIWPKYYKEHYHENIFHLTLYSCKSFSRYTIQNIDSYLIFFGMEGFFIRCISDFVVIQGTTTLCFMCLTQAAEVGLWSIHFRPCLCFVCLS